MARVSPPCDTYQWLLNVFEGLIRERLWNGEGGMHQLLTVKEPKQSLATFEETIQLLMKVRMLLYA